MQPAVAHHKPMMIAFVSSVLAIIACASGATGRPAKQTGVGAQSKPTSQPDEKLSPELEAALAALTKEIPEDVREHHREPTAREKMAGAMVLMLLASTNGLNDKTREENRKKESEVDRQLDEQFKKLHDENKNTSEEVRRELDVVERLMRETSHLLDFLNRPATFPSDEESEKDLARRIEQIPRALDRTEVIDRDLKYHNKRLELLQEMAESRNEIARGGPDAQAARQKLRADADLLAATDAQYKAQLAADKIRSVAATRPSSAGTGNKAPAQPSSLR